MPTGNIPRFTHQAHTYEMPVKNAFTYSLCLATLLSCPSGQHLTAADGGITAVGGGKISRKRSSARRTRRASPSAATEAHVSRLAIIGNTAIWFSVLASWCRTTAT